MDKLLKWLGLNNLSSETMETMLPLAIIAAVVLLIVLILLIDAGEDARMRRWVDRNSGLEIPMTRWRTIIPWHREGSRWYVKRCGDQSIHYGVKSIRKEALSSQEDYLYRKINKTIRVNTKTGRYMKRH